MKHTIVVSGEEPTLVVHARWGNVILQAKGTTDPFVLLTREEALALARVLTLEANR